MNLSGTFPARFNISTIWRYFTYKEIAYLVIYTSRVSTTIYTKNQVSYRTVAAPHCMASQLTAVSLFMNKRVLRIYPALILSFVDGHIKLTAQCVAMQIRTATQPHRFPYLKWRIHLHLTRTPLSRCCWWLGLQHWYVYLHQCPTQETQETCIERGVSLLVEHHTGCGRKWQMIDWHWIRWGKDQCIPFYWGKMLLGGPSPCWQSGCKVGWYESNFVISLTMFLQNASAISLHKGIRIGLKRW